MPPITFDVREDVANRLMGGQTPKGISKDLGISLKTIYRLKGKFQQEDGTYLALPAEVASTRAFSRETLVQISEWLVAEPKLTLREIKEKLVTEGLYNSIEEVPDASTLWRRLRSMGFSWRKPVWQNGPKPPPS